jgi:hypothetical protein
MHFARCASCGEEHASTACPSCRAPVHVAPTVVRGRLHHRAIALADVAVETIEVSRTPTRGVWLDGATLYRQTPLGPERIGSVLAGLSRVWLGERLGVGFYRAGGYARAFVFRRDHGVLDDRVALPKLHGELVSAHAAIADDRAWLFITTAATGRLVTTCVVIAGDARVLAAATIDPDVPWLAGVAGACAIGDYLFVPTDAGVARVEITPIGVLAQTRVFAETAEFVLAGDRLARCDGGLDVVRRRDALRMHLT